MLNLVTQGFFTHRMSNARLEDPLFVSSTSTSVRRSDHGPCHGYDS